MSTLDAAALCSFATLSAAFVWFVVAVFLRICFELEIAGKQHSKASQEERERRQWTKRALTFWPCTALRWFVRFDL